MIYNTLNFRTEDAVAVIAGMLESGSKVVTKGYLTKWSMQSILNMFPLVNKMYIQNTD